MLYPTYRLALLGIVAAALLLLYAVLDRTGSASSSAPASGTP